MYKVRIFVTLKESILDPAGTAVKGSLEHMGFDGIREVRIGKLIELTLDSAENPEVQVKKMCETLLVNLEMEAYHYEIIEEIHS